VIFTLPWAFLGMAALPALAAIYLLRSRSRNRPVSSLMLWTEATRPHAGGRILKRLHVPLILLLELATLALLVLAATGPHWPMQGGRPPLAVVLDDSFSMRAGGDASPRAAAEDYLHRLLADEPDTAVRFVLAGAEPLTLGVRSRGDARLGEAMDRWTCGSPAADLETAVTHAMEAGGHERVLVLTDHAPASDLAAAGILWRAFGRSRPNAAIIHAARARGPDDPRCLVEVANFAADARTVTLTIQPEPADAAPAAPAARPPAPTVQRVRLDAGERRPLVIALPEGAGAVRVALDADALPLDDQVLLLPDDRPPVRVDLRVVRDPLRQALRRALEATGRARLTGREADLIITDGRPPAGLSLFHGTPAGPPERWSVTFVVDEKAEAFIGPFIIDPTHPLCEGLDLESVIWAAAREPAIPGTPVISAGNVALVTDAGRPGGRRDIRIRLTPDLSNLTQSTNWPALVWNLLAYRSAHLPGLHTPNVRLGAMVLVPVPAGIETVEVRAPGGGAESRTVHDGRVALHTALCGRYDLAGGETWTEHLAAAALAPAESDLRAAETGDWGAWDDAADTGLTDRPVAWLAILLAAALLVAHLALVGRSQGEQTL